MQEAAGNRPGRPPEADISRRVHAAVLALLAAEGYHGLSISAVAARAGVPRSTLYRRGLTKARLAVDAITSVVPPIPEYNDGDPLDDLARSVSEFLRDFIADDHSPVIMALHAHALHDDQLAELVTDYLRPRGALLDRMIGRAIDAGRVDESLDAGMVRDLVIGPIIYRWLMTKEPAGPAVIATITAAAIRGLAPAPASQISSRLSDIVTSDKRDENRDAGLDIASLGCDEC